MKRKTAAWKVSEIRSMFPEIEFPEYQREPNIWDRDAKQRLVDSILRRFDIASVYFYKRDEGLECIDGRQRLNAIMAFLGENRSDEQDNGFPLRIRNEIVQEMDNELASIDGLSFAEIEVIAAESGDPRQGAAKRAIERFVQYPVTVILLSDVQRPEEFNLQFLRLNLGTLINAGEKLKAMIGDMRDLLFDEDGLGRHGLLRLIEIPTRRYARELVAAQILCQALAYRARGEFTRTRYYDLQKFVKQHSQLGGEYAVVVEEIRRTLDWLRVSLADDARLLRNRAITVSVVLLAWRDRLFENAEMGAEFRGFLSAFVCRLQWQVRKMRKFSVDEPYRYLVDFQRDVTQAAVEKPAVERRHRVLEAEYRRWRDEKRITGDEAFKTDTGKDPAVECRGEG